MPMTREKLNELQSNWLSADQKVKRGPIQGRIVLKPAFRFQIEGYSFPAWIGTLGTNPLPPGNIVSRYKGSDPAAELADVQGSGKKEGHWIITGPIQHVAEWYESWLALLDGEEKLRKGL